MAKAMGWVYAHGAGDRSDSMGCFYWDIIDNEPGDGFDVPNSDAPLHEHLAFVGRVAQALGPVCHLVYVSTYGDTQWSVCFKPGTAMMEWRSGTGVAPDPSWAAMLAAIEARKGR